MYQLIKLTEKNLDQYGVGCIKNKKHVGVIEKKKWLLRMFKKGYESHLLWCEDKEKAIGVIEYGPADLVPRNIDAQNYLVIQCLLILDKEAQGLGLGSGLIQKSIERAKELKLNGVVILISKDTWLPDHRALKMNSFETVASKEQFQLMVHKLKPNAKPPKFHNFSSELGKLRGLNLLYSNQCPFHKKCAIEVAEEANRLGLTIQIKESEKNSTPFGSFALVYNGEVLSNHYVSKKRFFNIMTNKGII